MSKLSRDTISFHRDSPIYPDWEDPFMEAVASGCYPLEDDPYWEGVYDRALIAWEAFALAELGTRTPTALDLKGRPELAALYEALK